MAGNRAPSVILWFDDGEPGQLLMHDVCVPSNGLTKHTYYCCLQWNAGKDGGGYCGIQDHPNGKVFIFSMWDPITSTKDNIKAVHVGHGTQISRFGGEGTGLKSMNFSIGWKPDHWYTIVVKRWEKEDHSYFGFWVLDQTEKIWRHFVTFDYPVSGACFTTRTACFVEDWRGTGENTRCALYKNGYKYTCDNKWLYFRNSRFHVNQEEPSRCYNENYDCIVQDDHSFCIKTGGKDTKPTKGLGPRCNFSLSEANKNKFPNLSPLEFDVNISPEGSVVWKIPESCTPQLRCKINVNGTEKFSVTDSELRSADIDLKNSNHGDEVEVVLTDILDRDVSKKILV